MIFPVFICYLASLVATLVLVSTSLSQSPADPLDGLVARGGPEGCVQVQAQGSINYRRLKKVAKLQQSIVSRALDRQLDHLPCGDVRAGEKTEPFRFAGVGSRALKLQWKYGAGSVSIRWGIESFSQ